MSTAPSRPKSGAVVFLQEFSVPLLVGVVAAMVWANLAYGSYHDFVHWEPFAGLTLLGHPLTVHFLVNDVFMVFFFAIAAAEITEATLPGGSLNPPKKAINPLFATVGGVVGPVGAYFVGLFLLNAAGAFPEDSELATLRRGWGVPTATDIALAWLVARTVFGAGHPAVNFLLLLAIADDAIGLAIIAIFYGDPVHPAEPQWLGLVAAGMAVVFVLRTLGIRSWVPYLVLGGALSWIGFLNANLHPALALVPIVPFMPAPKRDVGMFTVQDEIDLMGEETALDLGLHHATLHQFVHAFKAPVDFGLFFFALANAGVELAGIGAMTWLILGSLVVGKTVGIGAFGWLGAKLGFPLPDPMGMRDLVMAGFVAALGLTVALFVAGEAFTDATLQGQAKMGALFSGVVGIAAIVIGRGLGFGGRAAAGSKAGGAAGDRERSSEERVAMVDEPPAPSPRSRRASADSGRAL